MNQNLIIGILVVLILLGGGYFLFTMNPSSGVPTTTTTSTTQDSTSNPVSTTVATPGLAIVITNPTAAPTNSTAVVTGTVTPNGAPTTYWYDYGTSADLGKTTSEQSIGSGFSAIPSPAYITALSANTTYYFRLNARNSFGTVTGKTLTFNTNNLPPIDGNAPTVTTNNATNVARTAAILNAHVNPRSLQTTYWFEYGDSPSFGQITSLQSGGNGNTAQAISASVAELFPLTKYYFRVNAQNQFGTVNGTTQIFTTSGPTSAAVPVVTTQVASPVAATTATLRGTVNPYGAETSYWFEYSTDQNFTAALKTTPHKSAGARTTTIAEQTSIVSLESKTTYYYRIDAQNSAETVRGDALTFTTK